MSLPYAYTPDILYKIVVEDIVLLNNANIMLIYKNQLSFSKI